MKKSFIFSLFAFLLLVMFLASKTNAQTILMPEGWTSQNWLILSPVNPNHANPNGITPHEDQVLGYGMWTSSTTFGYLETQLVDVSKLDYGKNGILEVDVAYNEYFMQFMDFGIVAIENNTETILWQAKYNGLTYLNWRTIELDLSQFKTPKLNFMFIGENEGDLVIIDVGKLLDTGIFISDVPTINTPPKITWEGLTSYIIYVGGSIPIFQPHISYTAWDDEDGDLTNAVQFHGLKDVDVNTVGKYTVLVTVTDNDGAVTSLTLTIEVVTVTNINNETLPTEYELSQNYPNPFNPSTVINYSIPENGLVILKVFNILGQEVAELVNDVKSAGNYKASFDANDLPSGVYVYTINAGNFTSTKKMLLTK